MRTQHIFLASLLSALYGCQPETPAQQAAAPAEGALHMPAAGAPPGNRLSGALDAGSGVVAVQSSAAPVPAGQVMQPAASEATRAALAPAEKTAHPAANKMEAPTAKDKVLQPAVMEQPAPAAPAPAVAAPTAKAEPAPAAETRPEAKPEPAVSETEAMQLAKKNNCFACHAIDKKVVGPAWKDIAAKYRGDSGAEARLSDKIAKGGSGVWGVMVMPPSPQVSEADRKILARFVLSLK